MTRYGNRGKVKSRTFPRFPQRLGTRTRRGFPHSPSDGGCGYYEGQYSRTARIAGLFRFLHRTENAGFHFFFLTVSYLTRYIRVRYDPLHFPSSLALLLPLGPASRPAQG